jgi:hypothetical protein
MVKYKIITKDDEIYDMLTYLNHFSEINVPKDIDLKVLNKILKSTHNNIVIEDTGKGFKLRKVNDFSFNVYLKRIL